MTVFKLWLQVELQTQSKVCWLQLGKADYWSQPFPSLVAITGVATVSYLAAILRLKKSEHNEKRDEKWQMHTIYRFHMHNQILDSGHTTNFQTPNSYFFQPVHGGWHITTVKNEPPTESGCDTSTFGHFLFNSLLSTALMIIGRATNHLLWCWSNSILPMKQIIQVHCLKPLFTTVWNFLHCIPPLVEEQPSGQRARVQS